MVPREAAIAADSGPLPIIESVASPWQPLLVRVPVPAVPAACKGNQLLTDSGCETNGYGNFDKIWFWRTPTAKCEQEGKCVPYSQWDKSYREVQGQ